MSIRIKEENVKIEKSTEIMDTIHLPQDIPLVRISDSGKAQVVDSSDIQLDIIPRTLPTKHSSRKYAFLALLGAVLITCVFFVGFYGENSGKFTGKNIDTTLKAQSVRCINIGDRLRVLIPHSTKDERAFLLAPSDYTEEAIPKDSSLSMNISSLEKTLFITVYIAEKEDAPVELRTFHRLTLENMTAQLGAVATSDSRFFETQDGYGAFDTRLRDDTYDYGITTTESDSAFATMVVCVAAKDAAYTQEDLDLLITEIANSFYLR